MTQKSKFKTWGEAVMARRLKLCLPCSEVAARAGVTGSYLGDIEKGNRPTPHRRLRLKVCKILELDPAEPERLAAKKRCPHCDRPIQRRT
ncbi:MAG: helix-turn-helix domain-containing protein [Rhodanobacteraceae bacterium]|nr:helix-turn-helix domain-containing protein [Rhodanobacteraceae bacterium]